MDIGGKEIDKKTIIIIVLIVLLIFAGWLLFGSSSSRSNVSNDGERIDGIRNDISRIEEQQQRTIERIESVESGLADSARRLDEISNGIGETEKDLGTIAGAIEQSAERVTNDQERIARVQRILEGIRKRNEKETK